MKYYSILFHILVIISACSCTFPGIYPGIPLNYLDTFNSPFFSVKFDQSGAAVHPDAKFNAISFDYPQTTVSIPLVPSSLPIALFLNHMVENSGHYDSFESSAPKIFQFNSNPYVYGAAIGTTVIEKVDQGEEKNLVEIIEADGMIPVLKASGAYDEGDKNNDENGSGDDSDDGSCKGDCLGDKDPKEEIEAPEEESTEKDVDEVKKPEETEKEEEIERNDESKDLASGDVEQPKAEELPSINIGKLETL